MKYASLLALSLTSLLAGAGCGAAADEDSSKDESTDQNPDQNPDEPAPPATNVCNIDSNYPGDEFCILPPAEGEGIQMHAGPADYDDPEAVAPWLIGPGNEDVRCYLAEVSEGGFYYLPQKNRMRSGSHHMLVFLEAAEGKVPGPSAGGCEITRAVGSVPGSQTPSRDFPSELAPEDAGIARWFPENTIAGFQLHYVNNGDETLMREAWINIYKKDESEVTDRLQGIFMVGDLTVNIPANTREVTKLAFTPTLPEPIRVFQLNGHSHAHTETFTVWRRPSGGDRELVYKSFDWAEPDELTFNSVVLNPAPDEVAKTDGGLSGKFMLNPGDTLEWECDVNNTSTKALEFANEAYTAEMCLLAGSYVYPTGGHLRGGCSSGSCFAFPAR